MSLQRFSARQGRNPARLQPKSGKQRRTQLRQRREQRQADAAQPAAPVARPTGAVPVTPERLAPYNSYGEPLFIRRGYYQDIAFTCAHCGMAQIWTAAQQQWWYEVAKGYVYSTAKLCRACRRRERERRTASRAKSRR